MILWNVFTLGHFPTIRKPARMPSCVRLHQPSHRQPGQKTASRLVEYWYYCSSYKMAGGTLRVKRSELGEDTEYASMQLPPTQTSLLCWGSFAQPTASALPVADSVGVTALWRPFIRCGVGRHGMTLESSLLDPPLHYISRLQTIVLVCMSPAHVEMIRLDPLWGRKNTATVCSMSLVCTILL